MKTKLFVIVAILVLGIASMAHADVTWNFSSPTGALSSPQTYTSNGVSIVARGYLITPNNTGSSLYGKFTSGDPTETGLGMNTDSGGDHEIDTAHYIQLDLQDLINKGYKSFTMEIGSVQNTEGYKVLGDTTQDSFPTSPVLHSYTNMGSGNATDTFTYTLDGSFRYLDITATSANVLIMDGATAAPIPGSILLLGSGLLGLVGLRRKN